MSLQAVSWHKSTKESSESLDTLIIHNDKGFESKNKIQSLMDEFQVMTCQKRFVKKPCMFENLLSTDSSGEIPSEIMSCDEILLERNPNDDFLMVGEHGEQNIPHYEEYKEDSLSPKKIGSHLDLNKLEDSYSKEEILDFFSNFDLAKKSPTAPEIQLFSYPLSDRIPSPLIKEDEAQPSEQKNEQKVDSKGHPHFKKNVNMPKAVFRYLVQYHHEYKSYIYEKYPQYYQKLSKELNQLDQWVKTSKKKHTFGLVHFSQFFGEKHITSQESKINRTIMYKILTKFLRSEIIPNNQVKDKLEYLVASKVFQLRCRNPTLATRMQFR